MMSKRTPKVFIIEIIIPPAIAGLFDMIEGDGIRKTITIADSSAASQFPPRMITVIL